MRIVIALMVFVSCLPAYFAGGGESMGKVRGNPGEVVLIPDEGIELLKFYEGFRPDAYHDHRQWSIGYGTRSEKGETITRDEAERKLIEVYQVHLDRAKERYPDLNWMQQQAVAALTYNIGLNGIGPELNRRLREEWWAVDDVWDDYIFAGGQEKDGLKKRRKSEISLYYK